MLLVDSLQTVLYAIISIVYAIINCEKIHSTSGLSPSFTSNINTQIYKKLIKSHNVC